MFRASLASIVLASCAALSGCSHFSLQFDQLQIGSCFGRGGSSSCAPTTCDSGCCPTESCPCVGGPLLTPPDQPVMDGNNLPFANPPRLAPAPQSSPTPYRP